MLGIGAVRAIGADPVENDKAPHDAPHDAPPPADAPDDAPDARPDDHVDRPDRPDRRGDRRHGPRDRRPGPLSKKDTADALLVLGQINPGLKTRIERALDDNAPRARAVLRHMWDRFLKDLNNQRLHKPALYELRVAEHRHRIHITRLVRRIHKARREHNDKAVENLTDKLRRELNESFEVRYELRQHELKRLERRIEKLRTELAEHREHKDELIDEALGRMLSARAATPDHPTRAHAADKPPGPPPPAPRRDAP
jgi:hypothetical protein